MDKEKRCSSRKIRKSCLKDPEICKWTSDSCTFIAKIKFPRCKCRKYNFTCEKDMNCKWHNDKCYYNSSKQIAKVLPVELTESKTIFHQRLLKQNIVSMLEPLINKNISNTLVRLEKHRIITSFLNQIDYGCINNNYSIHDFFDISTDLNAKSYVLVKGKGFGRSFKIFAKTINNNPDEIEALYCMSEIVIKKQFRHFPLLYINNKCFTYYSHQSIIFSEYTEGTLSEWMLKSKHNISNYMSALFQIYMAISMFLTMGFHLDNISWHNFSYLTTDNNGGWWWYQINDKNFYIKDEGHLWLFSNITSCKKKHSDKGFDPETFIMISKYFKHKQIDNILPNLLKIIVNTIIVESHKHKFFSFDNIFKISIQCYKSFYVYERTAQANKCPISLTTPNKLLNKTPFVIKN